jgi:hypothetical protein
LRLYGNVNFTVAPGSGLAKETAAAAIAGHFVDGREWK